MDVFTLGGGGRTRTARGHAGDFGPGRGYASIERVEHLRRGDNKTARARCTGSRRVRSLTLGCLDRGRDQPAARIQRVRFVSGFRTAGPAGLGASPEGDTRRRQGNIAVAGINGTKSGGRCSLSDARGRYRGRGPGLGSSIRGALQAGFPFRLPSGTRWGAAHAPRRSSIRGGNHHRWKPGIFDSRTAFGSIDEVSRPRIGIDANALRGPTGLHCQATRSTLRLLGK